MRYHISKYLYILYGKSSSCTQHGCCIAQQCCNFWQYDLWFHTWKQIQDFVLVSSMGEGPPKTMLLWKWWSVMLTYSLRFLLHWCTPNFLRYQSSSCSMRCESSHKLVLHGTSWKTFQYVVIHGSSKRVHSASQQVIVMTWGQNIMYNTCFGIVALLQSWQHETYIENCQLVHHMKIVEMLSNTS